MRRWMMTGTLAALLCISAVAAGGDTQAEDGAKTQADKVKALGDEYSQAMQKWAKQAQEDREAGKPFDMASRPNPADYAEKFMKLAKASIDDPAAADALAWIVTNMRGQPISKKAVELLLEHHPESKNVGTALEMIAYNVSAETETLLRRVMKSSSSHSVQGHASFALAQTLKRTNQYVEMLDDEARAKSLAQYYGDDYLAFLKAKKSEDLKREIEELYDRVVEDFSDVSGKLADRAKRELFEIRHLSVGCEAPEIAAEDVDGTAFKLSDYRGKVVMLDFWGNW